MVFLRVKFAWGEVVYLSALDLASLPRWVLKDIIEEELVGGET